MAVRCRPSSLPHTWSYETHFGSMTLHVPKWWFLAFTRLYWSIMYTKCVSPATLINQVCHRKQYVTVRELGAIQSEQICLGLSVFYFSLVVLRCCRPFYCLQAKCHLTKFSAINMPMPLNESKDVTKQAKRAMSQEIIESGSDATVFNCKRFRIPKRLYFMVHFNCSHYGTAA